MTYLLTAMCDDETQDYFECLRRKYFPPERNIVPAHICLFHQLPLDGEKHILTLLENMIASKKRFTAKVLSPRSIGKGVAFFLQSPELNAIHSVLSRAWDTWLIPQDRQGYRPHIVVQNKVLPEIAKKSLEEIEQLNYPTDVDIVALKLWRYHDGPWEAVATLMLPI